MVTTVVSGQLPTESVSVTIVEEVAKREDVDPLDLTPLNDVIDPDALNTLVDESGSDIESITFSYHGYEVVIEGAEQVTVTPREDGER